MAPLVLNALKRDRTPREIVAQALDCASWVAELKPEDIVQIYSRFSHGDKLAVAFQRGFGTVLDEEALNQSHQIVILATALDPSTARIVDQLNARAVAIKVVIFQVIQHGGQQLLSRAWLNHPGQTQAHVATAAVGRGEKEPRNGEFHVSVGEPHIAAGTRSVSSATSATAVDQPGRAGSVLAGLSSQDKSLQCGHPPKPEHSMSQLTIVAHIQAHPDHVDLLKAALEKLIAPTRAEQGCLQYDLHQDNSDPAHFMFYENWTSRALWQTHMGAPHVAAHRAATEGMVLNFRLHEMSVVG